MDKATKAIRRSGVRLKSISGGHGDVQMIISQLGEVKTSFKTFAIAQAQASEDALKWASSHENRAIAETFTHLAELGLLWSDVQKDFSDQLKEYKSLYELILEGEKHVTHARETLVAREQREAKLRKEYKKASKKAPVEEVRILKERMNQAERSRDLAHLELVERVGENEALKMMRIKEGLLKLGAAYQDLAHKSMIIFTAHQSVTNELPEVRDRDLHDVKYTGSDAARKYIFQARDQIKGYSRSSPPRKPHPPDDPPPPYTPSLEHLNDLSNSRRNGFNNNSHNTPSNINNSSMNNHHPLPNGVGPAASPLSPTAPSISSSTINSPLPNSPPSHIYPALPTPPVEFDAVDAPHPPSDPEPKGGHQTTHFQSVPNLGDDSSLERGLRYPPFNVTDNSSFNDSNFHPDTSSSSPSLLCRGIPKTSTPANTPPFNPYYDWLPAHIADKMGVSKANAEGEDDSSPKNEKDKGNGSGAKESGERSVRPKNNLNPFLDDSTDEEDNPSENTSGAVKKPSVKK